MKHITVIQNVQDRFSCPFRVTAVDGMLVSGCFHPKKTIAECPGTNGGR